MVIEYQHNPGWKWRFDYPGMGLRITTDDGSVIHFHVDDDNGPALAIKSPSGEVVPWEGYEDTAEGVGDIEVKPLEVDWSKYWYEDQEWRK